MTVLKHYLNLKNIYFITFSAYLFFGINTAIPHLGGHGLYLPFNTVGWIFISFVMGLASYQIGKNSKIIISKIMVYSVVGIVFMVIPIFYDNSEYSHLASMRLYGLLLGFVLFVAFHQFDFDKVDKTKSLYIVLLAASIQLVIQTVSKLYPEDEFFVALSNFNAMAQSNIYATFLCTSVLISFYLILTDKDLSKSLLKKTLAYSMPLLSTIQLIQLQSRTGYLSLFLGTSFILVVWGFKKNKPYYLWIIALFMGLFAGLVLDRNERMKKDLKYSLETRLTTYSLTFDMIKENPLSGIGYGGFLSSFRHHYAKKKEENSLIETIGNNNMSHPHNEFLFWTVEGGIIPLIGMLIIFFAFIIMIWKAKKNKGWLIAGTTVPILIHTQLELPFYISLVHWFIFIYLLYMIDDQVGNKSEINISFVYPFRIFSLVIPIAMSVYMMTALKSGRLITKFELTGYNNPSLLVSMPNPHAWQKKYETLVMKINLALAKQTNNRDKLKEYIDWSEAYVKHSPYLFIYYDLATAYESLGNSKKAWQVYNLAKYLYPGALWRDKIQ